MDLRLTLEMILVRLPTHADRNSLRTKFQDKLS